MIYLIAAIDQNRALGYKNELLVKLPNDMKHFKSLTTGGIVVMGRKTYDSIGRPLPKRTNIVISKNPDYDPDPSLYIYDSVETLLHEYENYAEKQIDIWVIGGESIYHQFLPYVDYIYLTVIDHQFKFTDCYFPEISFENWMLMENIKNESDELHPYDYYFVKYKRKGEQ